MSESVDFGFSSVSHFSKGTFSFPHLFANVKKSLLDQVSGLILGLSFLFLKVLVKMLLV